MDWTKIRENYPHALKIFEKWGENITKVCLWSDRYMYDFFDENNIFIVIDIDKSDHEPCFFYLLYGEDCKNLLWPNITSKRIYITRSGCEAAAFEKAFKLLDVHNNPPVEFPDGKYYLSFK